MPTIKGNIMRKLLTGAAVGLLAIGMTACSSSPDGEETASAPGPEALENADGVVDVTFWHGFGGVNGEALDARIADFNAANEGTINVTASFQGGYADLLAKYTAGLRDDSVPTVVLAGDIASGYLRDVQRSVSPEDMAEANPDDLDLNELLGAAANYYTAEGELLAVPMATSTPVLWVNPALLEQAGVDPDISLDTLNEVVEVAQQVTDATGVAGLVQPFDGWWFEQLTAASGNLYCTPDNGRGAGGQADAISLTEPAQAEAFGKVADLYKSGAGLDVGVDGSAAVTAFTGGQVAMMFNSSGAAGPVTESGIDFDVRPYPLSGDASESGPLVGGSALWLSGSATDAEKVAGWKLMSYLASAEQQETFSQATGYVPINTTVVDSPSEQAFLAENPHAEVFIDQVTAVPEIPATAGCLSGAMTAIRDAVVPQMQAIFAGQVSLEEGLATAETAANDAIGNYLEQVG
jgi:sn-glycerol 3-phosphate transport system substrate-binding protein